MNPTFTFVHAADLHLDARFGGVDASDPRVRDALLSSTFEAFDRICEVCEERGAEFLIIAGDAYNVAERSVRAQTRFQAAAKRLKSAGVRVYVVAGNHDPLDGGGPALAMPDNVTYFPSETVGRECFPSDDRPLAVLYGRSYAHSAERANLAADFKRASSDPFAIGVLHANVGGQEGYEPYAPCSLEDLRAGGMDYWALGHVHTAMTLAQQPHVVYPGSPQGLNPNEIGAHGCVVVTVAGDVVDVDFVETARVVWERLVIDVGDVASVDEVIDRLESACAEALVRSDGRPVIMRADLTGRSSVHDLLADRRVFEDVVDSVRDMYLDTAPWVWVDRIRNLTAPPIDCAAVLAGGGFPAEVVRVAHERRDADVARRTVEAALAPLERALRGVNLEYDPVSVVERARDLCLDRLIPRKAP